MAGGGKREADGMWRGAGGGVRRMVDGRGVGNVRRVTGGTRREARDVRRVADGGERETCDGWRMVGGGRGEAGGGW